MKRFLKNMLFLATILFTMLFMAGVDSLAEMGISYVLGGAIICSILVLLCAKIITIDDIYFSGKFK